MRTCAVRLRPRDRRRATILTGVATLALIPATAPGLDTPGVAWAATVIQLEAENFAASHNAAGAAIVPVACGAARGGLAVDGMESPGDDIEWPLTLAQDFVFRDSLRSAGSIGVVRQFAVLFLPSGGGPPVAADTLTTPAGAGIG